MPSGWEQLVSEAGEISYEDTRGGAVQKEFPAIVNGEGLLPNYEAAARWFRMGAASGTDASSSCLKELGYLHLHGRGVAQDYTAAVRLLRASEYMDAARPNSVLVSAAPARNAIG